MSKPITLTAANFQSEVLESDVPVIVDFWAPWCGPCRLIAPVLEEQARVHAGRVKVAKLNVDEEPHLAGQFRIRGIPTLLHFEGGKLAGQQVGFAGAGPLRDWFSEIAGGPYRVTL